MGRWPLIIYFYMTVNSEIAYIHREYILGSPYNRGIGQALKMTYKRKTRAIVLPAWLHNFNHRNLIANPIGYNKNEIRAPQRPGRPTYGASVA